MKHSDSEFKPVKFNEGEKFIYKQILKRMSVQDVRWETLKTRDNKPSVKVITRGGVDVFITANNHAEYSANKLRLINYENI